MNRVFSGFIKVMLLIIKHIRNIFKDTVTLENGEELPLSRHRSKELRQQFLSYMKENI